MNNQDEFYRQIHDMERDHQRKQRREKWEKREKSFWKAFLFTENGKPKSGLMIYTFCLSFVLLGFYLFSFFLVLEYLSPMTEGMPAFAANLLLSLAAGMLGLLMALLLHRLLTDKRLVFGAYLWILLFAAAAVITLSILLWGTGAIDAMLVFFAWFVVIPLAMGLGVSWALYRRDYHKKEAAPEEPEWKKYVQRR